MVGGNILITLVCFGNIMIKYKKLNNILNKLQMFPLGMWWKHFQNVVGKFQMTANCYRQSNVVYMLMLHSKCCINVPIGSRLNTLLECTQSVIGGRGGYVLKMFSLVSRPPHPQWEKSLLIQTNLSQWQKGFLWTGKSRVDLRQSYSSCFAHISGR